MVGLMKTEIYSKISLLGYIITFVFLLAPLGCAATYYVDATGGRDANSGISEATAWKSIGRVNGSNFQPFKRGEIWREQLTIPSSGASSNPITFGAYGTGAKPKLLGSASKNESSDWNQTGTNQWVVVYPEVGTEILPNPSFDTGVGGWTLYYASGRANASGTRDTVNYDSAPASYKVTCINMGASEDDIQLTARTFSVDSGYSYRLTFRAKSSSSFVIPNIAIYKDSAPWTSFTSATTRKDVYMTSSWTTYVVYFKSTTTASDARLTFYLGNSLPNGATFHIDSVSLKRCRDILDTDVGNLVLNGETAVGRKVWEESDLMQQGDFWYDEQNMTLKLFSLGNPLDAYSIIECALKWGPAALISINGKTNIVIDNLDIRYAGAHGIFAVNSAYITVRSCDLSYIGGSKQYERTRYGNGIEFWDTNTDTTVEFCRINQVYDAAVTTQGLGDANRKYNQNFHYNIITNCEYAFEFWNNPASSSSNGIYFQNNTCAYAGRGWSHSQRPIPVGSHIVLYDNTAATSQVFVRNNIFYEATSNALYISPEFNGSSNIIFDYNVYYQSSGYIISLPGVLYDMSSFSRYQQATGQDIHSVASDPLFVDPTGGDFALQTGSPCIGRGIDLGFLRDFDGYRLVPGKAVDMGALQSKSFGPPRNLRIVQ
jgi:hypothetical protein